MSDGSDCAKKLRFVFAQEEEVETHHPSFYKLMMSDVLKELTWYDSSPWADVFINNVFSTLPSSDGRKISLKDAFPLGGIT